MVMTRRRSKWSVHAPLAATLAGVSVGDQGFYPSAAGHKRDVTSTTLTHLCAVNNSQVSEKVCLSLRAVIYNRLQYCGKFDCTPPWGGCGNGGSPNLRMMEEHEKSDKAKENEEERIKAQKRRREMGAGAGIKLSASGAEEKGQADRVKVVTETPIPEVRKTPEVSEFKGVDEDVVEAVGVDEVDEAAVEAALRDIAAAEAGKTETAVSAPEGDSGIGEEPSSGEAEEDNKPETPVFTPEDEGTAEADQVKAEPPAPASVSENVEPKKVRKREENMSDFSEFITKQMELKKLGIEDLAKKTKIEDVCLQALLKGVAVVLELGMARQIIVALCLEKPEIENFISLAFEAGVIQEPTQKELTEAIPGLMEEIKSAGGKGGGTDIGEKKPENGGGSPDKTVAVVPDTVSVRDLLNSIIDKEGHGRFIKGMMKRLGLTIEKMADRTKIHKSHVSFLRGTNIPKEKTAKKIAGTFGFNDEDTELYLQITKELGGKIKGPHNLPVGRRGETSFSSQLSPTTFKFNGPAMAKTFMRLILLDAHKRLVGGTVVDKKINSLLVEAGFGEDNITTSEIKLMSLRELSSMLNLTDNEKGAVAKLLKFVQAEFTLTLKGENTEAIKAFLFG